MFDRISDLAAVIAELQKYHAPHNHNSNDRVAQDTPLIWQHKYDMKYQPFAWLILSILLSSCHQSSDLISLYLTRTYTVYFGRVRGIENDISISSLLNNIDYHRRQKRRQRYIEFGCLVRNEILNQVRVKARGMSSNIDGIDKGNVEETVDDSSYPSSDGNGGSETISDESSNSYVRVSVLNDNDDIEESADGLNQNRWAYTAKADSGGGPAPQLQ